MQSTADAPVGGHKLLMRETQPQLMQHAVFGGDDKGLGIRIFFNRLEHARSRADLMRNLHHVLAALGMRDNHRLRVIFMRALNAGRAQYVVRRADPVVDDDIFFGHLLGDPTAQVAIGREEHLVVVQAAHHRHRIGRSAANMGFGFDLSGGIDIGHHRVIGIVLLPIVEALGCDRISQRTTRTKMRQEHLLRRAHNLGRFGHKMHAAKDDDIGFGLRGLDRQAERIAGEIGQVLDLGNLVVVREHDRVLLLFQAIDLRDKLLGGQIRLVILRSCLRGRLGLGHDLTCAPSSGVMVSVPLGKMRQNSLRTRPVIMALLLLP